MTPVSILAIVLSVASILLSSKRLTVSRLIACMALLLVHIAAAVYYYYYSQTASADASAYYYDTYGLGTLPWGLSTEFVAQLCYVLKVHLGATYLDCFFFFQTFGFAGLMIMARVFDEIEARIGVTEHRGYWILLFLPSVSFWTAGIGKDAPLFFAIALCVWAMLNLRPRFLYFCVSLGVMILFRAHVALLAVSALAGAAFFGSSASLGQRLGLFAVAITGFLLTSGAVESSLGVDPTSVSSMSEFLEDQNDVFAGVAGTTSMGDAPFIVRVLSLLFRPLFLDAHGVLGLVASVENAAFVIVILYSLPHRRDLLSLVRNVFFVRFAVVFAFVVLLALSLVYYNVGLGLRQRVMAYPMIFSTLVALWSLRRKPSPQIAPRPANTLMVKNNPNRPAPEL